MTLGFGHVERDGGADQTEVVTALLKAQRNLFDVSGGDVAIQIGGEAGQISHGALGGLDVEVPVAVDRGGFQILGRRQIKSAGGLALEERIGAGSGRAVVQLEV